MLSDPISLEPVKSKKKIEMFVKHLSQVGSAYRQTGEQKDEQSPILYIDEALGECRPPWLRQIITGLLSPPHSGYAAAIIEFFCSFPHLGKPILPPKFNVLPYTTLNPSKKFHRNPYLAF